MKRRPILIAIGIAALVGVTVTAALKFGASPKEAAWQGWVEADYLFLGPDDPGRLVSLNVNEGDVVSEGTLLFEVQPDIQEQEWLRATAQVDEAKARLARAEAAQQRPEEIAVLEEQEVRAQAAIEQSKPALARAEALVKQGYTPVSRVEEARATYQRDMATLHEIQKQIRVGRLEARAEDIDAARTMVAQAEANLAAAQTRHEQRRVTAPAKGLVQEVFYRPGEVVPAGRPVVSLLPLGNLKLRFFVSQSELPKISPGQLVAVRCDGCADDLRAKVSFLSSQAEFTPPVIFSEEERQKLVFRIEARPEEPEQLRVGQPVTVVLEKPESSQIANANK